MASEKVETVIAGNYVEMEREASDEASKSAKGRFSKLFWHGGSVYDAWFSCSSNQANYYFIFIIIFFFHFLGPLVIHDFFMQKT